MASKPVDLLCMLNEKSELYNQKDFVPHDPIQVPKSFSDKEDVEIIAFLTATIAWGQRKTIINNAGKLAAWMSHSPAAFIRGFRPSDLKPFADFKHRTFNGDDCLAFMNALQRIYLEHDGLENVLRKCFDAENRKPGLGWHRFKEIFFAGPALPRTFKHLPDPLKGSAAKRMNMFLRWMVRRDDAGVDFGLWPSFTPAELYIPLDVHVARSARKLGLLTRKQNDWKAVMELTGQLRALDPHDPARFDFALFGMSAWGDRPIGPPDKSPYKE